MIIHGWQASGEFGSELVKGVLAPIEPPNFLSFTLNTQQCKKNFFIRISILSWRQTRCERDRRQLEMGFQNHQLFPSQKKCAKTWHFHGQIRWRIGSVWCVGPIQAQRDRLQFGRTHCRNRYSSIFSFVCSIVVFLLDLFAFYKSNNLCLHFFSWEKFEKWQNPKNHRSRSSRPQIPFEQTFRAVSRWRCALCWNYPYK